MNKYKKIKIFSYFRGYDRNTKLKKNIFASFLIKGANFFLEFFLVSLLLIYLDTFKYGIIVIMLSLVTWFTMLDFGIGQGLRNKFAEAVGKNKHRNARIYISTCYLSLGVISIIFFCFFLIFYQFIQWSSILTIDQSFNGEISILSLIIFGCFSLNLILNTISNILWADQKSGFADLILLLNKIIITISIYTLTKISSASLIYVGITYSVTPLIILFIFSIYLYNSKYKIYSPSFKFIDFKFGKKLFSVGWKFFILQTSYIVLMLTDNIIITQLYGPEAVTPYHIAGKYYSVALVLFFIVSSATRSVVTEAFTKRDFSWIKEAVNKQKKILIGIIIFVVLMVIFSNNVFNIWVGEKIIIDYKLSIGWGLFVIVSSYSSIYIHFLNGVGKFKLQMINASIGAIINVPLSIFLAIYIGLGSTGVILATSITLLIYLILGKVQYEKIINKKAVGIWNE